MNSYDPYWAQFNTGASPEETLPPWLRGLMEGENEYTQWEIDAANQAAQAASNVEPEDQGIGSALGGLPPLPPGVGSQITDALGITGGDTPSIPGLTNINNAIGSVSSPYVGAVGAGFGGVTGAGSGAGAGILGGSTTAGASTAANGAGIIGGTGQVGQATAGAGLSSGLSSAAATVGLALAPLAIGGLLGSKINPMDLFTGGRPGRESAGIGRVGISGGDASKIGSKNASQKQLAFTRSAAEDLRSIAAQTIASHGYGTPSFDVGFNSQFAPRSGENKYNITLNGRNWISGDDYNKVMGLFPKYLIDEIDNPGLSKIKGINAEKEIAKISPYNPVTNPTGVKEAGWNTNKGYFDFAAKAEAEHINPIDRILGRQKQTQVINNQAKYGDLGIYNAQRQRLGLI